MAIIPVNNPAHIRRIATLTAAAQHHPNLQNPPPEPRAVAAGGPSPGVAATPNLWHARKMQ